MSFGFSIGDFIAVGKLVADIISILKDAEGSGREYQELVRELENLARLLHHIDRLPSSGTPSSVIDTLKSNVSSCKIPLEQIHARIKKYEQSLGSGSHGQGWKAAKEKIQWRMCEPKELQRYQMYLQIHIGTINGLLASLGAEQMALMSLKTEENHLQIRDRLDQSQGFIAKIGQNSTTLVAAVGSLASMMENMFRMVSGEITSSLRLLQNTVVNVCVMTQQIHGAVLEIKTAIVTTPQTKMSWFQEPFCIEDGHGVKLPVPAEYDLTMIEGVIQLQLNRTDFVEAKIYRNFTITSSNDLEDFIYKRETPPAPGTSMVVRCLEVLWGLEIGPCPIRACTSQKSRPYSENGRVCCECGIIFENLTSENNLIPRQRIIGQAENFDDPEVKREQDEAIAKLYPHRRMPAGIEVNVWNSPFLRNSVWAVPRYPAGDDENDPGRRRGSLYGTDFDVEGLAEYYDLSSPAQFSAEGLNRWRPAPPMEPPCLDEWEYESDEGYDEEHECVCECEHAHVHEHEE